MFVSIRLLVVESIQAGSATVSMIMYSVKASRNCHSGPSRLHEGEVVKSTNRAALTGHLIWLDLVQAAKMESTTNKRKETNINSGVV